MSYTTIGIEGGLFPPDLLERISLGDGGIKGQATGDFGLPPSRRPSRRDAEEFLGCAQVLGRLQSAAGTLTGEPHHSDP